MSTRPPSQGQRRDATRPPEPPRPPEGTRAVLSLRAVQARRRRRLPGTWA